MENQPPFIDKVFLLGLLTGVAALIAYILYRLGLGEFAKFPDFARSTYFNFLSQRNIRHLHTQHFQLWFYAGAMFYLSYHLLDFVLVETPQGKGKIIALLGVMFCLVNYVGCFVLATTLWVSIWGLPQRVSVEIFLQHQDYYYFYAFFWIILIDIGIFIYQRFPK